MKITKEELNEIMVKNVQHQNYDHEFEKFRAKKRYVKEDDKKFYTKRKRKKEKQEVKNEG